MGPPVDVTVSAYTDPERQVYVRVHARSWVRSGVHECVRGAFMYGTCRAGENRQTPLACRLPSRAGRQGCRARGRTHASRPWLKRTRNDLQPSRQPSALQLQQELPAPRAPAPVLHHALLRSGPSAHQQKNVHACVLYLLIFLYMPAEEHACTTEQFLFAHDNLY